MTTARISRILKYRKIKISRSIVYRRIPGRDPCGCHLWKKEHRSLGVENVPVCLEGWVTQEADTSGRRLRDESGKLSTCTTF